MVDSIDLWRVWTGARAFKRLGNDRIEKVTDRCDGRFVLLGPEQSGLVGDPEIYPAVRELLHRDGRRITLNPLGATKPFHEICTEIVAPRAATGAFTEERPQILEEKQAPLFGGIRRNSPDFVGDTRQFGPYVMRSRADDAKPIGGSEQLPQTGGYPFRVTQCCTLTQIDREGRHRRVASRGPFTATVEAKRPYLHATLAEECSEVAVNTSPQVHRKLRQGPVRDFKAPGPFVSCGKHPLEHGASLAALFAERGERADCYIGALA